MSGKVFEYMAIMDRIKNVTQCRTQQELAQFFDVSQSCISDSKKRLAIPSKWLLSLLKKKGINPEWVQKGLARSFCSPMTKTVGQCAAFMQERPTSARCNILFRTLASWFRGLRVWGAARRLVNLPRPLGDGFAERGRACPRLKPTRMFQQRQLSSCPHAAWATGLHHTFGCCGNNFDLQRPAPV